MAQTLGRYILHDLVAADALAEVYRAADTALGRTVTVKVLRTADGEGSRNQDAVLEAARRAMALSHPNVAELFDICEQDGRHFLVFEHVAGESLRATIAGTPLNVRRAVELGVQLADALADAHGRSILHRGIRPESILVSAKGRPKILDFGLASGRAVAPKGRAFQQMAPEDVECLSPEQVLGETGDERSDVFALGCVLFEMLTGTSPFSAATASDTAVAILGRTPPPPSQMNARVPERLDRLVLGCLAKSLDLRTSSAAVVASELREIAEELEREDKGGTRAVRAAPRRRKAARARIGVAVVLVCAAALAALVYFLRQ